VGGCCTCLLATWFAGRRVRRLTGASPVGRERLNLGAACLKTRAPEVCGAAPVRSSQTGDRLRRGTAMDSTAPPQRPSWAPVPFPPLPPTCILPRAAPPRCIAVAQLFFTALVASDIDRNGVFPTGDAVATTRGTPSPPTGGGAACAVIRGGFLVRRRRIAVGGLEGGDMNARCVAEGADGRWLWARRLGLASTGTAAGGGGGNRAGCARDTCAKCGWRAGQAPSLRAPPGWPTRGGTGMAAGQAGGRAPIGVGRHPGRAADVPSRHPSWRVLQCVSVRLPRRPTPRGRPRGCGRRGRPPPGGRRPPRPPTRCRRRLSPRCGRAG